MITPEFIATLRGKHIAPDVVALLDEVERLWAKRDQETARANYCKERWHATEAAARIVIGERDAANDRVAFRETELAAAWQEFRALSVRGGAAVQRLMDRIAQLEGIQRNQEAALAHWRSEADRDAGKIARLERERQEQRDRIDSLQIALLDAIQDAGDRREWESQKKLESKKRGEAWRLANGLAELLTAQREWSLATFGPDLRTEQILRHVAKECAEIAADPSDTVEWVDVILLAMDGYHRNGGQPEHLMRDLQAKQQINFGRRWVVKDGVCEHVREGE